MANLLYLVHRMPYPPDKGDKVRSFHVLKHLAARHRVFVGTFMDDPDDARHAQSLAAMCSGLHVARLRPGVARLKSLPAFLMGESLSVRCYRDAGLARWIAEVRAQHRIDAALVFSSAMAQYTRDLGALPTLVDFVDVDSAKWAQYADRHRWPLSWLYRREAVLLLEHERATAARARRSYFVTEHEAALFRQLAPESAASVEPMCNGVDAEFFAPDPQRPSPYEGVDGELPVVFTGAMDYWPNIDAVTWFAREMLPALRAQLPQVRFHIVGRNPSAAVRALASPHVVVSGTVPDVRPYLQHAAVVVAPLRLARGVQNKVLEAMAMARPVVATDTCARAIDARPGVELCTAATAADFVRRTVGLLTRPERGLSLGAAARDCVLRRYSWEAHLASLEPRIAAFAGEPA